MQGTIKTVSDDLYNVNEVDQRIERGKALLSSLAYSNHLDNIYREVVYHMDNRKIFLDPNLSLNKFSALIGTNTTYLSNVINKYFGCNFKTLLNNYRIEHCKKLLTDTSSFLSIKEIAKGSGFTSLSTFYATFKKTTHFSPLQYRILAGYESGLLKE